MSKLGSLMMLAPHVIILYLLFYNMQSLTGNKQFFGVSITQEYINKDEFQSLNRKYKKLLSIGVFIIFSMCLLFIFILDKGYFASIFFILTIITYQFLLYFKIHNKAKELKYNLLNFNGINNINLSSKSVIDIKFINERDKLIKKFRYIYLLPVFIISLASIYTLYKYNNISDIVPIHWNFFGVADSFIKKSYLTILCIIGIQFILSIILSFISISSIKSRVRIDTENIEQSRINNIKYLNKVGYAFLAIMLSTILILTNGLIAFIHGPNLNILVAIFSILVTILSTIYLIIIYIKSPNSKSTSSYTPDDDEDYWILGCIYNNPNDPSFMVQKKFGIGWTMNIATPIGKVFLVITVLSFIVLFFILIESFFI